MSGAWLGTEAVDSSQLTAADLYSPICLPSQAQHSSPDVTLISSHLLPNVTWFSHTTFGNWRVVRPITLSGPVQTSPRKALVTIRTLGRRLEGIPWRVNRGDSQIPFSLPPALRRKKYYGGSLMTPEGIKSGITTALLNRLLLDHSCLRETSAEKTTRSTLPFSC